MDVFIEGLKLAGEAMTLTCAVCIFILGVARLIGWMVAVSEKTPEDFGVDEDLEEVAAVSAALSFAMDSGRMVYESMDSGPSDAWTRLAEADLAEGGEF